MKILITGIHGFVGTNLVSSLKKENEIYGLDITNPKKEGVIKTFSWEDLEKGEIPRVDTIIHLAGKAHDTKNKTESDIYFKINTDLTKRIFDYFSKQKEIKKFIFFSSVKAAVDKVSGDILTEEVKPCPVGPYGESKIKAEEYILEKINSFPSDYKDKEVIILRPCMIHGQGNKGNLNLLYQFVKRGLPWPLGAFENKRTFTSIDNLSFIINALLTKKIDSGIYNVADDNPLSTNELIKTMCSAMGKNAKIFKVPRSLIKGIAKGGDILHLPLNSLRLDKLTENYVVSNKKLKNAIGVESLPVNGIDGITKTIKSFQNK